MIKSKKVATSSYRITFKIFAFFSLAFCIPTFMLLLTVFAAAPMKQPLPG